LIPNNTIYYYMTTAIKIGITFLIFLALGEQIMAQTDVWFYLRAKDSLFEPTFQKIEDELRYTGSDGVLNDVLSKHEIVEFKKTYRNANRKNLKKTFFVITKSDSLLNDLLSNASHLFEFGELIQEEDKKIFEPNDYGLTSTIGENIGAQVNLDYLDFLGLPKAWYYTTGSRDIIVGIADGAVDTTDIEFKGKTKVLGRSSFSKGHGMSVSETAAGQGNNGYGIPGICYDCSLYTTGYGQFKTLPQLVELSKAGAKVINCSWGVTRYYETAQQAIYEMLDNGTIIVAAGHNKSFLKSKGELFYYPASYDKVIAVSSGMHKYEDYRENIIEAENQNGKYYYAKNVRWYVGANAGFIDNDTTQAPSRIFKRSMRNFNSEIDILAPSIGIFRYSEMVLYDKIDVSTGSQTSGVTPLITGTIGLMFSLYPCLPADEVESILKITSTNIDHIEANKPFVGIYGSGMLHTGRAVEMIYQLYAEKETAYIQDQEFARWDFKITSLSKEIRIRNQKFTEEATLNLTAKNRIVIGKNTVLRPNELGSISLKIDPDLEKQCDLDLRDPSIEE
jgi:Subtilase family